MTYVCFPLSAFRSTRPRDAAVLLLAMVLLGGGPRQVGAAPSSVVDPLADDAQAASDGVPDPLERFNRGVFGLNLRLDRWVFTPLTDAYAFVVPAAARRAVRRALTNLDSPAVFVNDVLQIEPLDAGVTATRFAINSTVGLAGLFDVAKKVGLEGHHSDFGQTLALSGVPSGPYLVLPAVGPTTARDATGYLVDFLFLPTTYLLPPVSLLMWTSIHEGSVGITEREAHAQELHALEASSMDYYASLRSAFAQERTAHIWDNREGRGPAALARRALGALGLAAVGGEVGDAAPHGGGEGLEALALEH